MAQVPLCVCVSIVLYSVAVQYELGRMISGDRHGRLSVHVTAAAAAAATAVQWIEVQSSEASRCTFAAVLLQRH